MGDGQSKPLSKKQGINERLSHASKTGVLALQDLKLVHVSFALFFPPKTVCLFSPSHHLFSFPSHDNKGATRRAAVARAASFAYVGEKQVGGSARVAWRVQDA